MDLCWTYLANAFSTEIASLSILDGNPLSAETQNGLLKDYHYFHYVLDGAMRSWLIRISGKYLDEELKKRFQEHINFLAQRDNAFWAIMEGERNKRIKELLKGNSDIAREAESYFNYRPPTAATEIVKKKPRRVYFSSRGSC